MRLILDMLRVVRRSDAGQAGAGFLDEDLDQARQTAGADCRAQLFQRFAVQQRRHVAGLGQGDGGARPAGAGVQHILHRRDHLRPVQRLGQVAIHAGGNAGLGVARHGRGGHRQDRHPAVDAGQLPDCLGGCQAIHHRQPHIHQHHIVLGRFGGGDRLGPIARQIDRIACLAQDGGGDELVHAAVLRQQNAAIGERHGRQDRIHGRCEARWRRARGRYRHQREVEEEGAAFARGAVDRDLPAHQRHQPLADGEAETAAAMLPQRRPFGLDEPGEQPRPQLGRNAHAGVGHRHAQPAIRQRRHADLHRAAVGKFHRIIHQVQQHLLQPLHIADGAGGQAVVQTGGQGNALLGCGGRHQVEHLAYRVDQVEGLGADLQPAGLDAAEVQQFVHRGQQRLAAAARGLGIGALFGVQIGVEQQRQRAHNAMQRRADLMAHEGQEVAFLAVGAFGRRAGLHRLALSTDPGGHVVLDADECQQLAFGIEHRRAAQFIDEALAVAPVVNQLDGYRTRLGYRAAQQVGGRGVGARPLQEAAVTAQNFLRRVAGDLQEGGVCENNRAVGQIRVGDHHPCRGGGYGQRQRTLKTYRRSGAQRVPQIGIATSIEHHFGHHGRGDHDVTHDRSTAIRRAPAYGHDPLER